MDVPDSTNGLSSLSERRCRVFAHRMTDEDSWLGSPETEAEMLRSGGRWVESSELQKMAEAGHLECAQQAVKWLQMWVHEEDEFGLKVTRSYGLPTTDVKNYAYNQAWLYDNPEKFAGTPRKHFRVGVFDSYGRPVPKGRL